MTLDEYEVAYCSCCSDGRRDAFCRSHISKCIKCGTTGCHGCGTVNECDVCDRTLCEECMGDGGCRDCNRLHYCDGCLSDGLCPECSYDHYAIREARARCQEVACALMVVFDRTTNSRIRACVPRVLWQQMARHVWATRNQVEMWTESNDAPSDNESHSN